MSLFPLCFSFEAKKVKHKSDEIFSINLFVAGIIEMETGSKVCVLCALATNDNNDRCEANTHRRKTRATLAGVYRDPQKCVQSGKQFHLACAYQGKEMQFIGFDLIWLAACVSLTVCSRFMLYICRCVLSTHCFPYD